MISNEQQHKSGKNHLNQVLYYTLIQVRTIITEWVAVAKQTHSTDQWAMREIVQNNPAYIILQQIKHHFEITILWKKPPED